MAASVEGEFPYPGILTTADGSDAVVWVESHISHGACAYPITSSSRMGDSFQMEVANGKRNIWDEELAFIEAESEHSSASACEGFAAAGGRITNFTSGQGLVLMKEVLYTISGKRLPVVFNIGARALTSQSLNVHAGHDDVMAVADCGWGMLFARNAQEAGDLALICRRIAERTETPFLNVQDGFLTTHTVESIRFCEPELMEQFVGKAALRNLMDTNNPMMTGVVQNQDSYMKGKMAQRFFYDLVPQAVEEAMDKFHELTGRHYRSVDPYRMEDAQIALVGMGTTMETSQSVVDHMQSKGVKVGCVHVTSFRPFPGAQLVKALKGCKAFTVIERMDNPIAQSNPLTAEIKSSFADALIGTEGYPSIDSIPTIYSGTAGLGSRDVRPGHLIAAAENMNGSGDSKRYFTLGIDHELALEMPEDPDVRPEGSFSMRGHSVGGFGSVTTNKIIATIMGDPDLFGLHVQAYPKYGSEKKGLPTTYYLTIAPDHLRTHSELEHVEFIPLNDVNAFSLGNPLTGVVDGGMLFVQSPHADPKDVWSHIPEYARTQIREKNVRVLALDTVEIAHQVASRPDLVMRMQGIVLLGVFIKCTPFQQSRGLSDEEIFGGVEKALRKYFGQKAGEKVVQENLTCVKRGFGEVFEIPKSVIDADVALAA